MGAGIIPTSIHNGKLYFLFGKENRHDDSFPNHWADFGGGTDKNESYLDTAIREGTEEITGFLGSFAEMEKRLKKGVYILENHSEGFRPFRSHIFFLDYDEKLPYYYNNNQNFLQEKLDDDIIKKSKIFEKAEIRWFSIAELIQRKTEFKKWYQIMIDKIIQEKSAIYKFIKQKQSVLHLRSFKTHTKGGVMSDEDDADCVLKMRNGVKRKTYKRHASLGKKNKNKTRRTVN